MIYDHSNEVALEVDDLLDFDDLMNVAELLEDYTDSPIPYELV